MLTSSARTVRRPTDSPPLPSLGSCCPPVGPPLPPGMFCRGTSCRGMSCTALGPPAARRLPGGVRGTGWISPVSCRGMSCTALGPPAARRLPGGMRGTGWISSSSARHGDAEHPISHATACILSLKSSMRPAMTFLDWDPVRGPARAWRSSRYESFASFQRSVPCSMLFASR